MLEDNRRVDSNFGVQGWQSPNLLKLNMRGLHNLMWLFLEATSVSIQARDEDSLRSGTHHEENKYIYERLESA